MIDPGSLLALLPIIGWLSFFGWLTYRDWRRSGETVAIYVGFRALWLFCKLWHGVRPRGSDPLPRTGPAIVISNHTSPADPAFLQCRSRRLITFMMAAEYFRMPLLQPVFRLTQTILVHRTGRDTAALRAALRALQSGQIVGIFPEGGINLDSDSMREAKLGAAMLALSSQAPVFPAYIDRKVHTNRLVPGVLRPANARVRFGPPIDLSAYYGKRHDAAVLEEVTQLLMKGIRSQAPERRAVPLRTL